MGVLSKDQQHAYDQDGFTILPGAIDRSSCDQMTNDLWDVLEELHGIVRDDVSTWVPTEPRGLRRVRKRGVLNRAATPMVLTAVSELIGSGTWVPPNPWGGPLVTFPTAAPWDLPSKQWHIDYPARGKLGSRFGIKMLGLLTDMKAGGGATLLLRGSHRVVQGVAKKAPDGDAGASSDVRKILMRMSVDFTELVSGPLTRNRREKFVDQGFEIDEVRLKVFEFTGDAGDVILFDPWLYHTASPNTRSQPRLMVEQNLPTRKALTLYART